jgi:hypothetical protein
VGREVTYLKEKIYDLVALFIAELLAGSGVDCPVLVELSLLLKAFVADFTNEWLVAGVSP